MRLSIVGPVYPYRGGIAHFTTRLGQLLIEKGDETQVISFKRQYPAFLYPGKTDKDPSQEHPSVPAQYILDPLYPWTWAQTANEIKQWNPDLVLIQWWTTFWGLAFWVLTHLLKTKKIPVVFIIHNVFPHEERFFDKFIARVVLKNAHACVTLSSKEENRLRDLLPDVKIFSSQLPAHQQISSSVSKPEAREKLGIPINASVLLFFGIVRPYKGLSVLLDALGILKQEDFTPLLLVAGEIWHDEGKYRSQINRLGLQDQVRLENRFIPNEELGDFFSAADIFVAPYLGGTQSGAIKAALEFGLPVLASDVICTDLDVDKLPIVVHSAGDAQSLANDIRRVIQLGTGVFKASKGQKINYWDDYIEVIRKIYKS